MWPWLRAVSRTAGSRSRAYVDDLTFYHVGELQDVIRYTLQADRATRRYGEVVCWVPNETKSVAFASTPHSRRALKAALSFAVSDRFEDLGVERVVGDLPGGGVVGRLRRARRLPAVIERRGRVTAAGGVSVMAYGMAAAPLPVKTAASAQVAARAAVWHGLASSPRGEPTLWPSPLSARCCSWREPRGAETSSRKSPGPPPREEAGLSSLPSGPAQARAGR